MARRMHDEYWIARSADRMVGYMDQAEKTASLAAKAYKKAAHYINDQTENIMRNMQGATGLSTSEAHKLIQQISSSNIKGIIEKAIAGINDPKIKKVVEDRFTNASAYGARLNQLSRLSKQIEAQCSQLGSREIRNDTNSLKGLCKDAFEHTTFDLQQEAGSAYSFRQISKKQTNQILSRPWSGEHYSSRIWGNTQELAKDLQEELLVGALTGRSYNETANEIAARMGSAASDARRLIRTESTYIAGQGELAAYAEAGIDKYEYVATLDKRTSDVCQKLDGKVFNRKDAKPGINYPPMHPYCRSTTVAYFDDDVSADLQRRARDPETGKTYKLPADMTYSEWKKSMQKIGDQNFYRLRLDNEGLPRDYSITNTAISSVNKIRVCDFSEKAQKEMQKSCRRMLRTAQKQSLGIECSCVVGMDGKQIGNVHIGKQGRTGIANPGGPYVGWHTHPDGSFLSISDIQSFLRKENMQAIGALGHDASYSVLQKTAAADGDEFSKHIIKQLSKLYFGTEKQFAYDDLVDNKVDWKLVDKSEVYAKISAETEKILLGAEKYGFKYLSS